MGRFASTVDFYARYREPYPPAFFQQIASELSFTGSESLLDVGCGPAQLALGLAPFVARCTGIDPEPAMLASAQSEAAKAGVPLPLINTRLEDFSPTETFDLVTIGRAHHWLDREVAPAVLDRITTPSAHILLCGATAVSSPQSPWLNAYDDLRHSYAINNENELDRLTPEEFFSGSCFHPLMTIELTYSHQTTIASLIGRALSRSYTSPAALGDRRPDFQSKLAATLQPFTENGLLHEQILARASVFTRF